MKYYFHQPKSSTLRIFFTLFFAFISLALCAQPKSITGQVFDQETNEPLPFVNITVNNSKFGTAADVDGRFTINIAEPISSLTFSFVGYEQFTMPITQNTPLPLNVYMKETSETLMEVEVVAGENPAHRIIRNAVKNRDKNDPENLASFSYTSYNKLLVTLEADSLPLYDDEGNFDSSNFEVQNFMDRQHLFIMETASERNYKKPNKDTERVIANRVSGFKDPSFVLLASQLQSFTFYSDFVTVLADDYLNPVSGGAWRKYVFVLRDTTFSGADTTFIISFEPPPKHRFQALKGLLYINSSTWAIQNVIAEPYLQEGFGIKIQQLYERFEEGSWFPVQLNYDFRFYNVELNGIQPVGIGRTFLRDIKINPALERKDFEPVAVKIEDDATQKSDTFWNAYRRDTLDEKERETYRVIDSIGEAEKFERRLKWVQALADGKVRWKYFDFPLDGLLRYSIYEGFRLGVAAETNPTLVDWLKVGGNIAYGFGDEVLKWGYFGELKLHNRTNLRLGGGYRFDIFESGGEQWIDEPNRTILAGGNTRMLWIQQFDELSEAYGYLKWHPRPNLHTKVQVSRQNRFMPATNYSYLTTNQEGIAVWQNGFIAGLVQASVSYAPNDTYMEGPFGRRPIRSTYPTFTAQYTQGIDGFLDGTLDFQRLDLKVRYDFKTKELGVSSIEVIGGKVWGDVPYSYLYNGRSNLPNELTNVGPIYIADQFSFETMRNNEFLNDEFVQVMFRQNLQSRLLKIGDWAPDIEVMARALWGRLANPERHRGIPFTDAAFGFYETGLEINKIFAGFGVGAYYRFGPYQLPDEMDNWSFKLSYRFALF
jgi:hypothetical protein